MERGGVVKRENTYLEDFEDESEERLPLTFTDADCSQEGDNSRTLDRSAPFADSDSVSSTIASNF
jgi:hypothetical protein